MAAPSTQINATDAERRAMAERMADVFSEIGLVKPFSKSEKPASDCPLVRSPIDEKTETERARRVSADNWLSQHYYFNSDEGKRALELNYMVLEDVRRTFNQREAIKSMEFEQDQRTVKQQASDVFDELLRKSTLKVVAEATLNEQMERIAKDSMARVFGELQKNHVANEVTEMAEEERLRRLDPLQWQRDHYFFCSPEGQKALADHNDVLTDVRRIHNIKEVTAAMDLEQAQRQNKTVLTMVLEDMLRQFSIQKVIDATFTEQAVRCVKNNMALILDQLRYNARAKETTRAVEEERTRQITEGAATRFVRYNHAVCQPFLPEIRRKRSFVEVC